MIGCERYKMPNTPRAGPPACHGAPLMLQNIHVLPGPAVDASIDHNLLSTVAGHPLYPGFEHTKEYSPDHWHIANVVLQDLFGLHVDLQALVPVKFFTAFFQ